MKRVNRKVDISSPIYSRSRGEVTTLLTKFFARENDYACTKEAGDALGRELALLIYERLDVIEEEKNSKKPEGQVSNQVPEVQQIMAIKGHDSF